ncbi:hypothetical protein TNCV_5052811 [Trichonephila clavipes]|nr:hypothetical protein TNCV_5052811 [Trichonephila clavipes]
MFIALYIKINIRNGFHQLLSKDFNTATVAQWLRSRTLDSSVTGSSPGATKDRPSGSMQVDSQCPLIGEVLRRRGQLGR